jgi:NAD(P)-dependent dehydrogenase (short-subunit alcohol dehydrogenase family)
MKDLKGKSVIVTGGASGIGRSAALLLAEAGCLVTVADWNDAGCAETAAMIKSHGGEAQWIRTDVSSESDAKALVDRAVANYGNLHGACNAAGVAAASKPLCELTTQQWHRVININLTAPFYCLKYQIPAMLISGGGSIVIVASTASIAGVPLAAEYCSAKAGVLGLVRSASCEYARRGVRVNAVLPGATRTPMFEAAMKDNGLEDYFAASHPIGRFAESGEIATAIRWLISDEASFVTGLPMAVDGGYTSV